MVKPGGQMQVAARGVLAEPRAACTAWHSSSTVHGRAGVPAWAAGNDSPHGQLAVVQVHLQAERVVEVRME